MYQCGKCGGEWETNYCPSCARTIDRSAIESEQQALCAEPIHHRTMVSGLSTRGKPFGSGIPSKQLRAHLEDARDKLYRKLFSGMGMTVVGLVISIGSFEAAKRAGGGSYIVTYGLVGAGILRSITAITGLAKVAKIERIAEADEPESGRGYRR